MKSGQTEMLEIFEYRFTKVDPIGSDHIDPPSIAVYETLLTKGADEAPLPGLATSWSVSGDGLRWQLALRRGATFHSGDRCDAAAVVAALERCRWGDGQSRQLWYWDPVDKVVALDDAVIEIRLLYPYPRLPTLLWGHHTAICNVARRGELGAAYGVRLADGTGPYRLISYSPEEVVAESVLGGTAPAVGSKSPRRIRWRSEPTEEGRRGYVARVSADVVRVASRDWADNPEAGFWRFVEQPEISQFYLALRFDGPPGFSDLRLRRAVEAFIDRDALVRAALGGQGDGRRSPVPVGARFACSFDPASCSQMARGEALAILESLGFTPGTDGIRRRGSTQLRIRCVTQDSEPFQRLAGELSSQLREAGVVIEFEYFEPFEAFYRAARSRPQAILSKWLWQDAIEAVMGFSRSSCDGDGGGNWQGAHIPALDRAYDRYLQAGTPEELEEASRDVQQVFMDQLPYIPLCSPNEVYAISTTVEGFEPILGTLYPRYNNVRLRDG